MAVATMCDYPPNLQAQVYGAAIHSNFVFNKGSGGVASGEEHLRDPVQGLFYYSRLMLTKQITVMGPSTGASVETKPVTEKKRRKSDLVVMWITLWDVILYIVAEIWLTFQGVLEVGKLFLKTDDVWQIREWLAEHLPEVPDDFSQSWRDGILFCKLLNKLHPGCYPDANRLDTNFGVRNLSKAFRILEIRFDIIPKVTVEEIVTCSKDSESKLVDLLLQLKQKTDDNKNNNEIKPVTEEIENVQENGTTEAKNCIAKGTGLMVGFVGRAASFGVFFSSLSDLNLVVEIKGPSKTICSERVTKRSPKKKNIIKPWKPLSPHAVIRSSSSEESGTSTIEVSQDLPTDTEKCFIPLEYEIHSSQISFTYFPLIQGEHRIAVLSHGQHVSDSPYLVNVECSVRGPEFESMAQIKSALKPSRRCQKSEEEKPKKSSVRFQEPSERKERLGKILKRQVLRYIVKINGKDVVVDSDSIDNLATSLLKMDYELQKRPLIRRNSWGFVGDAERKISVIRQFGIDIDELESQSIKMQRSHSLSLSPITKKPPKISSSYECEDIIQQTILETVTEGRVSYFNNSSVPRKEEDDVFALVNEDFDRHSDVKTNGTIGERGDFDFNSLNYFGDKLSENIFCDRDVKEVDQSSSTRQDQMPLKSEVSNIQSLISSDGVFGDHLINNSECSSRLHVQIGEEFVEQKSEIKTEMISSDTNENSQITQLPCNQSVHMAVVKNAKDHSLVEAKKKIADVENSIEEFKNLEGANSVFVEEIPCTKTNARSVINYACQKNMFSLSNSTKADLREYENSKQLSNNGILRSNCEDSMSQTKENNNSVKNCQCKFLKKTTTYKGNMDCFVKNKHSVNEKQSKNIDIPKIRCKSFVFSNVKKNKTRGQRLHKYQHLGQKVQTNYDSYYTKRRRSSSKSSIEDSMVKKLHCIMKSVNKEDISALSKMASFKSTKNRTVSDPTYNSFNRDEERKNLEYNRDENVLREAKYENKEENFRHMSNSSFKGTINIGSYLSNICSKTNMNQNEYETEQSTEFKNLPQHLRKNFNIYHHPKNSNVPKEYSMIYESFSASAVDSTSNQSCESFVRSSYENSSESSHIKDSTSKNTCQFTYKHFNPSFQIDRESTVKKQIKLWETSTIQKNDKPISKHMDKLQVLPELVDIKAKLKFWENAYHHSENEELKNINISKNGDGTCKMEERNDTAKSISSGINLEGNAEEQNQVPSEHTHRSKKETNINDTNSSEKSVDIKMLNMDSAKAKTRSFSDPGVLDKPDNFLDDDDLHLGYKNEIVNPSSSKDEMSSSNDGNFIELFADDEESSMELLCSTEDEYIDDEISENISTYWGDLSLMKGLKVYDSSEYEEFLQLMNSESLQSCADECKFFGIATYFGHVAVKNRFWVLTKGAGRGNLSTSVQGIGQHNVAFVSVEYTRKDIYEVTYQVFTPGLYLISVRWMDSPIPGSPFLCKVTF
ncbi:hypothetical protein AVEN_218647-1 [Araneus ventricosus]|uniref:Calponin-homology (CH) domain-containing protein n=1 Tax=Araneus ventricosus TaxID=182803 RepID=A0A4Y2B6G2_ARAVE|nr:hypothetical protein AVEN_218647-1 [Araneus ventricosus]